MDAVAMFQQVAPLLERHPICQTSAEAVGIAINGEK
jgi:hypothetical protein